MNTIRVSLISNSFSQILIASVVSVSAIASCMTLTGCSVIKASPAENSGFLPHPELLEKQTKRAPFHGYWVDDPVQYEQTRFELGKVYVAPVDLSKVAAIYKASSGSESTKTERIEEAEELGRYFQEKIKLILRTNDKAKVKPVDAPGPGVLSLNLALIQVVPTNPGVNLVGTAAGFFVPGGGLIKIAGEGSVAMEGYVEQVDVAPKLREQYKDRQGQKVSLFSLKDYQRYAHIREAIDEWAFQITDLLNTPHEVRVEGSDIVSLNPL